MNTKDTKVVKEKFKSTPTAQHRFTRMMQMHAGFLNGLIWSDLHSSEALIVTLIFSFVAFVPFVFTPRRYPRFSDDGELLLY